MWSDTEAPEPLLALEETRVEVRSASILLPRRAIRSGVGELRVIASLIDVRSRSYLTWQDVNNSFCIISYPQVTIFCADLHSDLLRVLKILSKLLDLIFVLLWVWFCRFQLDKDVVKSVLCILHRNIECLRKSIVKNVGLDVPCHKPVVCPLPFSK